MERRSNVNNDDSGDEEDRRRRRRDRREREKGMRGIKIKVPTFIGKVTQMPIWSGKLKLNKFLIVTLTLTFKKCRLPLLNLRSMP